MKNYLLFLSLFLFLITSGTAASIKGGQITYTCIGNNQYLVKAVINRECSGLPITTFTMNVFNGLTTVKIDASRVSIRNLNIQCKGLPMPCSVPNQQGSEQGIEEHVYEGVVDFNDVKYNTFLTNRAQNCEVYFSFSSDGRDTAINTMSNGEFYILAMLNLCHINGNVCNTSPYSSGTSSYSFCCNQAFSFSSGLHDNVDFDSLVFDTMAPKVGINNTEVYVNGYSSKYPVTPFCPPTPGKKDCNSLANAKPPRGIHFDESTSDFIYTPTVCNENSAIVFRANEYRKINGKMEHIGFSEKEIGLNTTSCNNNNPNFLGANKFSICEGDKLCFTISTIDDPYLPDQTIPDTTHLTWDENIEGATFSIVDSNAREKSAEFCWQTKSGDANGNNYTFVASVRDDECPVQGVLNRGHIIIVKPLSRSLRNYKKSFKGKMLLEAIAVPNSLNYDPKNYRYQFLIRDSSNQGTPLFQSYNRLDSFTFTKTGTYYVQLEINNPPYNCPQVYIDTIFVDQMHLTSINPLAFLNVNIVPNPSTGVFRIEGEDIFEAGISFAIFSLDGKLVYQDHVQNSTINASFLPPGMYIIEIKNDKFRTYKKLIIE